MKNARNFNSLTALIHLYLYNNVYTTLKTITIYLIDRKYNKCNDFTMMLNCFVQRPYNKYKTEIMCMSHLRAEIPCIT